MLAIIAGGGLSFIQLVLIAIVVAGAVGILFVCLRQMGVAIPPFVVTIFWIVVCVVVGCVAIKFIAGML